MDTTFLGQIMPFLFLPFTLAGLIVGGIGIDLQFSFILFFSAIAVPLRAKYL